MQKIRNALLGRRREGAAVVVVVVVAAAVVAIADVAAVVERHFKTGRK